jgi:carboxyl-terminal processing protease
VKTSGLEMKTSGLEVKTACLAAALGAALALGAATPGAQAPQAVQTFDAAWTEVRDRHFDPTLNGVDWDAVRHELRPRAVQARTTDELRGILRDMLGRLGQSHFAIIPGAGTGGGTGAPSGTAEPGFDVRLVGGDLLVTAVEPGSPAHEAGVRTGWRIAAMAGTPVATLLRTLPAESAAQVRGFEAWRVAQARLRGPAGSTVAIDFEDGAGRVRTVAIARRAEQGTPVTLGKLPTMYVRVSHELTKTPAGAAAGLIRFNVWMAAVDARVQRAVDEMRGADGMILDLRGNPGGLAAMLMGIAGHFVDERRPLGVMQTRDNPPLRFTVNPRLVSADGRPVDVFRGPLAILVDGMSGSASECFAGGMQSIGRARIFGQTTMGQALPAQFRELPNGDVLMYAFGDFVTADGTRLEGRGVIPDETVPLAREDLLAGRDRTLEAAQAWIDRARQAGM